ncbi:universal stress protein [Amycolatopsis regifaucium]|uniref:Universal stress protein n=1 Tax=Amycolatopsis regifaucium TaxID=546365 RepID=A0A154MPN3_9PSEU|nr:universal stress protein [Amycolatopsis regifaucium]KZB85817.1 universal stress protein [Amycolatopsis regifaucium]OKA10429.1 universal stress protein [Amycolatopsis regifaucium]SFI76343.1 Nucleotide-binding universal stress protein, UspA family [Amycolatopsis regifaucium]
MPSATEDAVVVGIDGSGSAKRAAVWAAAEAVKRGKRLRLVHVYAVPQVRLPAVVPSAEALRSGFEAQGARWLAEACDAVAEGYPDLIVESAAREWAPVAALIQESLTATLIVLGSRGLGGFTGLLVGSTAVALAQHGHCPIVVARGRRPDDIPPEVGSVVVGTDGSESSDAALAFAFDEASLRGTDLIVVRVWNEVTDHESARAHALTVDPDAIESAERQALDEQLVPWRAKYPDLYVETVVARGRPVRALLGFGERAQLLVVGSRGRGGFQGMLLGSTSQALVAHSECPVAVVRPTLTGQESK